MEPLSEIEKAELINDPAKIKRLRDRTSLPLMKCKFALQEAGGDEEKAWRILHEQHRTRLRWLNAN